MGKRKVRDEVLRRKRARLQAVRIRIKMRRTSKLRRSVHLVREETEEAISSVCAAADPDWKNRALEAVIQCAEDRGEFISDDVWEYLDATRENRALGPVFRKAARDGFIEKTDRMMPSKNSHLSGKPVWRSLV